MSADAMTGIKKMFRQKGGPAMRNARKKINSDFSDDSVSSQALRYFSEVTLDKALPVFPALVALSCEAVGGDIKETILFGESIILTSAGADIHDDVIDQSLMKGTKLTVFGKFNTATAILAGDILLVQGFKQLTEASGAIPKEKAKEIVKLFSDAVTEICTAEALEMQLRSKSNLTPNDLLEVIKLKAVVPELCTKIGAIIGNGDSKSVKILGDFGRIYGINGAIIEEIVDLLDIDELRNRLKNECAPLPILCALQNSELRANLEPLLNSTITETIHKEITDIVLNSIEVDELQKILRSNVQAQKNQLIGLQNGKIGEELLNLLIIPLKYIEA